MCFIKKEGLDNSISLERKVIAIDCVILVRYVYYGGETLETLECLGLRLYIGLSMQMVGGVPRALMFCKEV